MCILLLPGEADPILIIDSDAVLTLPIAVKGFQSVARRNQKIGERLRTIQNR